MSCRLRRRCRLEIACWNLPKDEAPQELNISTKGGKPSAAAKNIAWDRNLRRVDTWTEAACGCGSFPLAET